MIDVVYIRFRLGLRLGQQFLKFNELEIFKEIGKYNPAITSLLKLFFLCKNWS